MDTQNTTIHTDINYFMFVIFQMYIEQDLPGVSTDTYDMEGGDRHS
jgi:hypothetical protein